MKALLVGLCLIATVGVALAQFSDRGPDAVQYPLQGGGDAEPLRGPSGAPLRDPSGKHVKCARSPDDCFRTATRECRAASRGGSGSYQVLESDSHAGGILADLIPGPITWYAMTYRCGRSDGRMPSFVFKGPQPVMPDMGPSITNCQSYGGYVTCQRY